MNFAQYIGIPFVPHGRGREGLDCWGLLRLIYKEQVGVELLSYSEAYGSTNDEAHLGALISGKLPEKWSEIPEGQERPGDGILLRLKGQPMHVGVIVAPGVFIHIHEGVNACLERYRRSAWKNRVIGFFRHRDAT